MSRLPTLPDTPFLELPPDWVCEVLSPTTEAIDRGRKMAIYARERVSYLWLLNPVQRTLETYRWVESRWTLLATHVGDASVRAEPFETLDLDMSRWWLPEEKTSASENEAD